MKTEHEAGAAAARRAVAVGQADEAKKLFQQVLEAPIDPEWAPEDREFKRMARELLDPAP